MKNINIIAVDSFLVCMKMLVEKDCEAIIGPQGGILVLNPQNCVVYQNGDSPYLSAHDYLGRWKAVTYQDVDYTPLVTDPSWEHP